MTDNERDLVERLRENPNYMHWLVIAEAADEIERLRRWQEYVRYNSKDAARMADEATNTK